MGARYKNYKAENYKNTKPGYTRRAWLIPTKWIDTFAQVVGNAAAGNRFTIDESHVLLAGKGAVAVMCAPKTITAPGEISGPQLGKSFNWKPKIYIPGDSAELLDMTDGVINDDVLLFVEDIENCKNGVAAYVQFGSKCDPATTSAGSFQSGEVGGDTTKGYELEFETTSKYFYNGVIQELLPDADIDIAAP
jgi:hypothetical protein